MPRRALLCFCFVAVACQQERRTLPPEAVVEAFISRMRGVHGEPEHAIAALELLSAAARENLEERARRASAAAGAIVPTETMIVPARFLLRFEPRNFVSTVQGQWAVVSVYGADPKTQIEEVRCVLEDGQWRVVIDFPSLPPIEKRAAPPAD